VSDFQRPLTFVGIDLFRKIGTKLAALFFVIFFPFFLHSFPVTSHLLLLVSCLGKLTAFSFSFYSCFFDPPSSWIFRGRRFSLPRPLAAPPLPKHSWPTPTPRALPFKFPPSFFPLSNGFVFPFIHICHPVVARVKCATKKPSPKVFPPPFSLVKTRAVWLPFDRIRCARDQSLCLGWS